MDVFLGDRFDSEERAKKDFEAHVAEVKSVIPADRLLVYELGSGWEPLCEFLGVSVPEQTYPHTNATTDFQKHNIELQR